MRHPDPHVNDYLERLARAAGSMPRDRRAELIGEIREHIDAALGEAGNRDESTVRNVLERLGSPDEIVSAASEDSDRGTPGALDAAGLVALIVPIVGWLAGAIVVSLSRAWTGQEKRVGLLLPWGGAVLGFAIALAAGASSASTPPGTADATSSGGGGLGPVEVFSLLTFFGAGICSAAYFAWRLHRHAER